MEGFEDVNPCPSPFVQTKCFVVFPLYPLPLHPNEKGSFENAVT